MNPSRLGSRPIRPLTDASPGSERSSGRRVHSQRLSACGRLYTCSLFPTESQSFLALARKRPLQLCRPQVRPQSFAGSDGAENAGAEQLLAAARSPPLFDLVNGLQKPASLILTGDEPSEDFRVKSLQVHERAAALNPHVVGEVAETRLMAVFCARAWRTSARAARMRRITT